MRGLFRKGQFKKATCAGERLSIMRSEECNKLLYYLTPSSILYDSCLLLL